MPRIAVSIPDNPKPVKEELVSRLEERAQMDFFRPEEYRELDWEAYDLYLFLKRGSGSYRMFEDAHRSGTETVNPYVSCRLANDRLARYEFLQDYVPVPEFRYGKPEDVSLEPPVVVKTREEVDENSHLQETVKDGVELSYDGEKIVQRYVDFDREYKGYMAGDEFRALEVHHELGGERTGVDAGARHHDTVEQVTRTVRDTLNMEMFGADVLMDGGHPCLIDVNEVASFTGVSDGADICESLISSKLTKSVQRPRNA